MLGTLRFNPLEIRIYSDSKESGRARFTLAHELGHLFMEHGAGLSMEVTEDSDLRADAYLSLDFVDLRRMEWQANFFAACLLLPAGPFVASFLAVAKQRDLYDRGFGMLYVDHQPVNMANFMAVTSHLSSAFNVSREVTVIRLKGLGYLNDARLGSDRHRIVGIATDA
jgi:Zn-dependent peptidase ImmA (M78 family)